MRWCLVQRDVGGLVKHIVKGLAVVCWKMFNDLFSRKTKQTKTFFLIGSTY